MAFYRRIRCCFILTYDFPATRLQSHLNSICHSLTFHIPFVSIQYINSSQFVVEKHLVNCTLQLNLEKKRLSLDLIQDHEVEVPPCEGRAKIARLRPSFQKSNRSADASEVQPRTSFSPFRQAVGRKRVGDNRDKDFAVAQALACVFIERAALERFKGTARLCVHFCLTLFDLNITIWKILFYVPFSLEYEIPPLSYRHT
jgi:hypothetical protein